MTNHDLRMSKYGTRDLSLSFDILRLDILRFCGSAGRRRKKRSFSKRLKKITFKAALTDGGFLPFLRAVGPVSHPAGDGRLQHEASLMPGKI